MPGYSGDLKTTSSPMKGGKKQKQNQKQKVHTGPRGGKYVMKNGRKVYLTS